MVQCVSQLPDCQGVVANGTANGLAPCCDRCQQTMRQRQITQALRTLERCGHYVVSIATATAQQQAAIQQLVAVEAEIRASVQLPQSLCSVRRQWADQLCAVLKLLR